MTDFEREPKPAQLDMRVEWQGEEGLISADFSSTGVLVETIHGKTNLSLDDLAMLYRKAEAYKQALNVARADDLPVVDLRERAA